MRYFLPALAAYLLLAAGSVILANLAAHQVSRIITPTMTAISNALEPH